LLTNDTAILELNKLHDTKYNLKQKNVVNRKQMKFSYPKQNAVPHANVGGKLDNWQADKTDWYAC
jgi:hypothetical protein